MKLPVQKPTPEYQTLDEIRTRKDELLDSIQLDNERFNSLWGQLFLSRKNSTKGEFVSGIISNSITAVDTFLLVRKLVKGYGHLFRRKR